MSQQYSFIMERKDIDNVQIAIEVFVKDNGEDFFSFIMFFDTAEERDHWFENVTDAQLAMIAMNVLLKDIMRV